MSMLGGVAPVALILIGLLIVASSSVGIREVSGDQQNKSADRRVHDLGSWDAGRVIGDETVGHVFKYVNASAEEWSLESVDRTCGCVEIIHVPAHVDPGETAEISISVTAQGLALSSRQQSIFVRMRPNTLLVGRIKVETVPEAYIIPSGAYLQVDDDGCFETRAELGVPALEGLRVRVEDDAGYDVVVLDPKNDRPGTQTYPVVVRGRVEVDAAITEKALRWNVCGPGYESNVAFRLVLEHVK